MRHGCVRTDRKTVILGQESGSVASHPRYGQRPHYQRPHYDKAARRRPSVTATGSRSRIWSSPMPPGTGTRTWSRGPRGPFADGSVCGAQERRRRRLSVETGPAKGGPRVRSEATSRKLQLSGSGGSDLDKGLPLSPAVVPRGLARTTAVCGVLVAIHLLTALALLSLTGVANADLRSRPSRTFVTDGPVHAVAATKSAIYIGGVFKTVGPRKGPRVGIDRRTGRIAGLPPVAGGDELVSVAVPDGSGGFFIGGDFGRVGSAPRRNLAHILANGRVDPNFDPSPNGYVRAILVSGSTVYVGGSFHEIGRETRPNVAALDAANGKPAAWNPKPRGPVYAVAVSGDTVYLGGRFDSVAGLQRHRLAAVDARSARVRAWNPDADMSVHALAVSGSTVYAGGGVWHIGGKPRNHIAALDAATGKPLGWNPDAGYDGW